MDLVGRMGYYGMNIEFFFFFFSSFFSRNRHMEDKE
jgi:hypothetical protein